MEFTTTDHHQKLLVLIIYKYWNVTQTERKITNFIRQNLDSFCTLADVDKAVIQELERLTAIDKRTGQISSHTWTYCHMKEGNFKALSLSSKIRKGFLMVKENWQHYKHTGQQN